MHFIYFTFCGMSVDWKLLLFWFFFFFPLQAMRWEVSWFGFWATFILKTNSSHSGTLYRKVTGLTFHGLFEPQESANYSQLLRILSLPTAPEGCTRAASPRPAESERCERMQSFFPEVCRYTKTRKERGRHLELVGQRWTQLTVATYIAKTRVKFALDFALASERDGCSFTGKCKSAKTNENKARKYLHEQSDSV